MDIGKGVSRQARLSTTAEEVHKRFERVSYVSHALSFLGLLRDARNLHPLTVEVICLCARGGQGLQACQSCSMRSFKAAIFLVPVNE